MLKNLKKLNDHIKKGSLKTTGLTMLVQLLIDSLVELLQVVLKQLSVVESKKNTEAQKVFLSGLRGNIVAFQNLKKQLENLGDNDIFGDLFVQPKTGELFSTKPKKIWDSNFVKEIVKKQEQEKKKELNHNSSLGL